MARILVIDDEENVRAAIRKMLQMAGHEIVEAADGEEAVRRYHEEPTDLVITDILMPGRIGLDVIEELRRKYPRVKIIVMTAYLEEVFSMAEELGANRSITKPFKQQDLLRTVQELLEEDA